MITNSRQWIAALVVLVAWPALSDAQTFGGGPVRVPGTSVQVRSAGRTGLAPALSVQLPSTAVQVPPSTQVAPFPDLRGLETQFRIDSLPRWIDIEPWLDATEIYAKALDAMDLSAFDSLALFEPQQGTTIVTPRGETLFRYRDDGASMYESGLSALGEDQWQRAVERFDAVIKTGKARVDGAMYWKAYALDKLGQRDDALATLQGLVKAYPSSRYLDDARALEIEVRKRAGQPVKPEDQANEDLKLMALNAVMQANAEQAIPTLEQILKASNSLKIKQRALFLLSTSDSPKAKEVLASIARGGANPDLQLKALRYLAMRRSSNAQLLADIYAASKDGDVKREIIRSLGMARDADHLLTIAKTETSPELRIEAIRQLGMMRANDQLVSLYPLLQSTDAKEQALRSMVLAGNADRVAELARQEADAKVRANAVRNLGTADSAKTGEALVQIYRSDKDPGVKKAVVDALYMQQNAKALVDLARQETDPVMKRSIVSRLSTMKAKEATDYMLELLK